MIVLKTIVSISNCSKESRNAEKLQGSSFWFLDRTTIVLMRGGSSDEFCRCQVCLGKYTLLGDEENPRLAMFERRLPFFGCGIGWCCFLLGFLCPLIWYIAALLYCCKYYNRDPRERPGLAASAVLAIIFTAATIIILSVLLIMCAHKRFLNSCGS